MIDAIQIEKLTQAIKIDLFPEVDLTLIQCVRSDNYLWGTGSLPVTYQFYHPDIKSKYIQIAELTTPVKKQVRNARPDSNAGLGIELKTVI
jgi:hypothetical protein